MAAEVPRRHVAGGYCLESEGGGIGRSYCALEAGQCDLEQQIWRSSREADTAGFFRTCIRGDTVREDVFLGYCTFPDEDDDDVVGSCAADAASCGAENGIFVPAVVGNTTEECRVETATFGSCGGRCVWSIDACREGEDYRLLPTGTNNNCTCDHVQVGGCKGANDAPVLCAVSPDSCDETQTYLTHDEVLAEENWACYLCRPPTTPPPSVSPTTAAPSSPTTTTTTTIIPQQIPSSNDNRGSSNSLVIGVTLAAVIGCGLIVIMICVAYRRQSSGNNRAAAGGEDPPIVAPDVVDTERGREIVVSEIEDNDSVEEDPKESANTAMKK